MISAEVSSILPGVEDDRLFNAANEIARASEVLGTHLHTAPHAILEWVRREAEGFLAEFGFGESLSVQPPYWFEIRHGDGVPQVFARDLPEYGEQSVSFMNAEGFEESIGEGLESVFNILSWADVDDGVILVSPTDFYKEYGSKYDVINIFRVVEVDDGGSRLVEGRYLLLNGSMTSAKRAFLLNWHNIEAKVPADATAQEIVRSPQLFGFSRQALESRDPIVSHARKLEETFERRFGMALLGGESDLGFYEKVKTIVDEHLTPLYQSVLRRDERAVVRGLRDMLFRSQRNWASERGMDPEVYIQDILLGRIQIGGIHPITGLPVEDELGIASASIDACDDTGRKRCNEHGEYVGEICPECRNKKTQNT